MEYHQFARQPYEEGEYSSQEDLFYDIEQGKVFVFRAGNDLRARIFVGFGLAAIFGALALAGLGSFEESVIFFVVCFIPVLLMSIVFLVKAIKSLLVVGPRGIVWRGGGLLWEDMEKMNASVKTIRTRYGPRERYTLWFQSWDGTTHSIAIHHRSNECPGVDPNRFISQVVKTMFDAHGTKSTT